MREENKITSWAIKAPQLEPRTNNMEQQQLEAISSAYDEATKILAKLKLPAPALLAVRTTQAYSAILKLGNSKLAFSAYDIDVPLIADLIPVTVLAII